MSDEEKKKEFDALLALFENFLQTIDDSYESWEVLEELMALRADFLLHHAMQGFGITWEDMLDLLEKDALSLSEFEREQVFVIRAAIDNLIDFAVVEEYQLAEDVEGAMEEDEERMDENELRDLLLSINRRYNYTYADVENSDVMFAMSIAASWITIRDNAYLMYMTQGDERVRPWHLEHEGFTALKSSFPQWLIPPIEHQCRCYLIEVDAPYAKIGDVENKVVKIPEMPEGFNRTFKESVAKGGRIFSDEHPYFQVETSDYERLHEIAERIRSKYLK